MPCLYFRADTKKRKQHSRPVEIKTKMMFPSTPSTRNDRSFADYGMHVSSQMSA